MLQMDQAVTKKGFGQWFDERSRNVSGATTTPVATTLGPAAVPAAFAGGISRFMSAVNSVTSTSGGTSTAVATSANDTPPDVEAGSASSVDWSFASLIRRGASAVPGVAPSTPEWTCGLSVTQRFQLFLLFAAGAGVLLSISFFVFLPVVVIMPSKFASGVTFGSLMLMTAFAFLRGPRATLLGFASPERRLFAGAYLGSIALTLYATLGARSYLFTLAATGVQVAALAWYAASFVPGGPVAMALFTRVVGRAAASGARGMASAFTAAGSSGGGNS